MTAKKLNPHAQALGRLGGKARFKGTTKSDRTALVRKAGVARSTKLSAKERQRIASLGVWHLPPKSNNEERKKP